jgi:hypothetical protein
MSLGATPPVLTKRCSSTSHDAVYVVGQSRAPPTLVCKARA